MHEENGLAERRWRIIVTMKDSLLLDSGLPLNFWAEAMDTANYLQNRLSTKSQKRKLIPNEAWTKKQQDVSHLRMFRSLASVEIPKEKRHKSDIQKNLYRIFIGYSPDTVKHIRIGAPKTRQLLIASDPYIDESKQRAKLLVEYLIQSNPKRKLSTSESKPRGRPRKALPEASASTPTHTADNNSTEASITEQPVTGETDIAMSATEINSKIHEPSNYDEAISDPVHGRQWREAIEEELHNLE